MKLESLRSKTDYYHLGPQWVRHRWPRLQSLNWFVKEHRQKLVKRDAIIKIGRQWFIDIENFPMAYAAISGIALDVMAAGSPSTNLGA